jgi:hypothetical protein
MTDPKIVLSKLQKSLEGFQTPSIYRTEGWTGAHWLKLAIVDCQKIVSDNEGISKAKDKKTLDRSTTEVALVEVEDMITELVVLKDILDKFDALSISMSKQWKLSNKHVQIKHDLVNRKGVLRTYLYVL